MQELLIKAKNHQKKGEWKNAVSSFEQYIKKSKEECQPDVYVSYAICLSRLGHTTQAREILLKGQDLYPTNEQLLIELFNLYNTVSDKKNAINVAQTLVKLNPKSSNNHFLLGKSYAQQKRIKEAKASFIDGLEFHHDMNIEDLKKEIQGGFLKNNEKISTEYIFLGGRSNFGSFLHNYEGKKLLTKISKNTLEAKRENIFYKEVCESFPILKDYVPAHIDSKVLDGILYLTIEMIESTPIKIEPIEDILSTSQKISSIPYDKIVKEYPNINYSFQLKNKPNPMVVYFTKIHEKYYNEKLFSSLYKLMKENNYPDSVYDIVQQLETFIMDNQLYEFIYPNIHYSLVHGDYNKSNSIVDKKDNTIKVFDWELFKIGPHFIDTVRYFSGNLVDYSDVKEIYLNNEKLGGKLSLIEKIFFLYALILLYILTLREKMLEKDINKYIVPALNEMEFLVDKFTKTDQFNTLQQLLKVNNENEDIILQLKKHNIKLKKDIDKYKAIHKNFENSKSWKITAPLRKVIQLISKNK